MGKRLALVSVLLLAACGGGGGDDDGPPVVAEMASLEDVPDSGFDGRVVGVELTWTNNGDELVDMTLAYGVELMDSSGAEANLVTLPDGYPSRPSMLPPGKTARGWYGFELTPGSEPDTLLLYGEIGDDPVVVDL